MRATFISLSVLMLSLSIRAADKPVEVAYFPVNAPVAVSIDAVKLKKNLAALGVPVEKELAKLKDEKKIDFESLTRAVMAIEIHPTVDTRALPTAILTMKNAREQLPKILQSETETTIAGRKAIKGKNQVENKDFYGLALDEKNLLFASAITMPALLKDGAKPGELAKEYEKADLAHDAVVVLAMKPLMAILKDQYGDLDKLIPPQAEQFWTAAKKIEAATITVNLSEETLLKGVFRADGAEGAETVKETLQGAVALLSFALPQVKQQLGAQLPPEAKPLILVIEALAKTTKFKVDGSTVTMTVARPKDFGN